ncbi:formylmethanofuran dehydrogenase subunit E family protein [Methanocorpusculum bavaricum]|jgi:formylmethanofuran dehydrogenase subunit E|uniref:formylmethanofuran dehydrogenase subunit E family protein n=1 Tax=Methanocorpusculum bavaricum TaxID=71518 RepID=UPI0005B26D48|nr:formylmethanofuran dehydrogenase subunit E family protein [Methanocorpusculum bavaricum]HJJ35015.1 formylmethanofuran dehydrogenase subunit E family protein [Methanocorpusculum sp.]
MTVVPDFDTIAKAHGHVCPGIALGYKIALEAAAWAGNETKITVLSYTQRCPLDALRYIFDLNSHPDRLTIENTNTGSYVLEKPDGSRLFIDEVPDTKLTSDELHRLKVRAAAKTATPEESDRLQEIRLEMVKIMLATPNEQLFTVREER